MSEWIKVSERLPEYGVPVLLAVNSKVQEITFFRDGTDDCRDWFEPVYFSDSEIAVWAENVTHWMPLPPAPEAE